MAKGYFQPVLTMQDQAHQNAQKGQINPNPVMPLMKVTVPERERATHSVFICSLCILIYCNVIGTQGCLNLVNERHFTQVDLAPPLFVFSRFPLLPQTMICMKNRQYT